MTLPSGWTLSSIGDITEPRVEQRAPTQPTRYIDIGSIDRESKRVGDVALVNPANAPTRARQWVRAGDVLVSMTRPNLNAVAMVDGALDGAVASTGFDVLRTVGVLPKWLYYRVRSDAFVRDICGGVQGVVYPAVRPADVRRHLLPIAPAAEQPRIVETIESYLSRLDAAVASLKRAQARLKAYRASALKAAVEGRLVPTEAALARAEKRDYEPAEVLLERILAERRRRWEEAALAKMIAAGKPPHDDRWKAKYPEPRPPELSGLPKLSTGWRWTTVGTLIAGIDAGKNFRCIERPPQADEVGVVKVSAVTWGVFNEDESKTCPNPALLDPVDLIRAGDVLFSRANTIQLVGACVRVDGIRRQLMLSDKILRLRVIPGLEAWLVWVLRSRWGRHEIESLATGNQESMRNISQPNIARIRIPLPPVRELSRVIDELEKQLSAADTVEVSTRINIARSFRCRQSVLGWAFSGMLVDQDTGDELANRLPPGKDDQPTGRIKGAGLRA